MKRSRKSKNEVTIEQLRLACWHVRDLMAAGVSENLAIRTLELMVDVYSKLHHGGAASPHHVREVPITQWSQKAKAVLKENPKAKPKETFRVEHGTPRRTLTRSVMRLWQDGRLSADELDRLAAKMWKLAVITLDEDLRLNKLAKQPFDTPDDRWAAAGIKF